jgi:hypothetical protein
MIFSEYNTRFINTLATEIEEKRGQLLTPPMPRTSPFVSTQTPLTIISSSTTQSSTDNTSIQTPPIKMDKEPSEQQQQQQQQLSSVKPWQRKKPLQQTKEPLIIIKETPKRQSEFQSSQTQQSQSQLQQSQSQSSSKTTGEANLSRRERDKVIAKVTRLFSFLDITFSNNKTDDTELFIRLLQRRHNV